jgi:hypothetical protein
VVGSIGNWILILFAFVVCRINGFFQSIGSLLGCYHRLLRHKQDIDLLVFQSDKKWSGFIFLKVEVDWYWILLLFLVGYWKHYLVYQDYLDNDWHLISINQLLIQRCNCLYLHTIASLLFFKRDVITVELVQNQKTGTGCSSICTRINTRYAKHIFYIKKCYIGYNAAFIYVSG